MTLGDALAMIGMKVAWMQYAERLAHDERQLAGGLLHPDNWIDEVYTPGGKRWSELGL